MDTNIVCSSMAQLTVRSAGATPATSEYYVRCSVCGRGQPSVRGQGGRQGRCACTPHDPHARSIGKHDKSAAAGTTPESYRKTRDTDLPMTPSSRASSSPCRFAHRCRSATRFQFCRIAPVGMSSPRQSPAPHGAALRRHKADWHDACQAVSSRASAGCTKQETLPF